mmetsp:Transcript_48469/g.95073  ORF Transcript_48469/g.95073 Transcript_48469/m.95073 type:complete len:204 (+) Transcript_48469:459-1070(+)
MCRGDAHGSQRHHSRSQVRCRQAERVVFVIVFGAEARDANRASFVGCKERTSIGVREVAIIADAQVVVLATANNGRTHRVHEVATGAGARVAVLAQHWNALADFTIFALLALFRTCDRLFLLLLLFGFTFGGSGQQRRLGGRGRRLWCCSSRFGLCCYCRRLLARGQELIRSLRFGGNLFDQHVAVLLWGLEDLGNKFTSSGC